MYITCDGALARLSAADIFTSFTKTSSKTAAFLTSRLAINSMISLQTSLPV